MGPGTRPWTTAALALVLALASLGWHAPGERRVVRGEVLAEAPTADVARCAWLTGGSDSQGLVGWVVPIEPHEADGWFGFRLTSSSPGQHDPLSITFYEDLGTCADSGAPLGHRTRDGWVPAGPTTTARQGYVPRHARWAVIGRWSADVTLYYSMPPQLAPTARAGAASTFSLTISDPPPWW